MKNEIYSMTAADMEVLSAAVDSPNLFFEHFFKKKGMDRAFQLDYNFTEKGKWQVGMCMARQTFIVVVGGIGTGKSLGVIMGASYHGVYNPGFRFMNIARESWQSHLMYTLLIEQAEDTLFDKLITARPKRPHPTVVIEYMLGEKHIKSTFEFMSLGDEKDATNIFSWRGDWISIEEAGRIDNLSQIVENLSTRLTGATAEGREFMGRMSLISNPWENPELWQMFDIAISDKDTGLAINLDTIDNKNVSEKQVKSMLSKITEENKERFMTGQRQDVAGHYFSDNSIKQCKSELLTDKLKLGVQQNKSGYYAKIATHLGIYYYQMPKEDMHIYYIFGDPGIGTAPWPNSPVLMVFDVTDAPKNVPLVALYWGDGKGSIMPWTYKLLQWIDDYSVTFAGIDSTASQKNMAEIMNNQYVYNQDKSIANITGMDFSGGKRYAYLISLRIALELSMFQWPHAAVGINSQLTSYDPIEDRNTNSKLAQDLVATLAMAAFAIRAHFAVDSKENTEDESVNASSNPRIRRSTSRNSRRSTEARAISER